MKKIFLFLLILARCTPTPPTHNKKGGKNKAKHEKTNPVDQNDQTAKKNKSGPVDTTTTFTPPPPQISGFPMQSVDGGCTVGVLHFDCACSQLDTSRSRDTLRIRRR